MFFKPLKERFGFVLVIVVAGLGTALLAGNDAIGAAVAIIAGLGFLAATGRQSDQEPDEIRDGARRKGSPFTYHYEWELSEMPDLAETVRRLAKLGLKIDEEMGSTSELMFNGGSQIRTRLLGGYFVAPRHLPIQAKLLTGKIENSLVMLQLEVQDTLKVAVRDRALEKRYVEAVDDIRAAVEGAVGEAHPRPVPQHALE